MPDPIAEVHIINGSLLISDYEVHWITGVFAVKANAVDRVNKLRKLRDKFIAKPHDQYAGHRQTWEPLDPDAHKFYVENVNAGQGFIDWQVTTHKVQY